MESIKQVHAFTIKSPASDGRRPVNNAIDQMDRDRKSRPIKRNFRVRFVQSQGARVIYLFITVN